MAKGLKTGGRDFKPGESGNPNGRPATPDVLKEARRYTRLSVEDAIHRELGKKHVKGGTKLKALIRSIINHAIRSGDPYRTNFILEQLFGKLPNKVDLVALFKTELDGKSEADLVKEAEQLVQSLKKENPGE